MDVDAQCDMGMTVLHMAVELSGSWSSRPERYEGVIAVTRVLMESGMNIYARDRDGFTGFDKARRIGWQVLPWFFIPMPLRWYRAGLALKAWEM